MSDTRDIKDPVSGKTLSTRIALYSESNTRWIVEVFEENVEAFEKIMDGSAQPIGKTAGDALSIRDSGAFIELEEMRKAWSDPIRDIMEGSK